MSDEFQRQFDGDARIRIRFTNSFPSRLAMTIGGNASMRSGRELLIASKTFAQECRWLSWWHFGSTLSLLVLLLVVAAFPLNYVARAFSSFLAGLVCVRMFIIFHDYQHRAILGHSKVAGFILWWYGILTLSPPSVWNHSHSHHHKHNSSKFGTNLGSFPVMTKQSYLEATPRERLTYLATRHPLSLLFSYLTVFLWTMCLRRFLKQPIQHFDGGVSVLVHLLLIATVAATLGIQAVFLVVVFPLFVACCIGGYLFYAQHNFPSVKIRTGKEWNHIDAALDSSSFMEMGPLMRWFTGNIGFHHVHHMNARIPFYRLPEAMGALEELQAPGRTSLKVRDIRDCFRLKLWDPERDALVGLRE